MTELPARGDVWWCEMAEIGRRPWLSCLIVEQGAVRHYGCAWR